MKQIYPSQEERIAVGLNKLTLDGVAPVRSCEELILFLKERTNDPLACLKRTLKNTSLKKSEQSAVWKGCKEVFGCSVM